MSTSIVNVNQGNSLVEIFNEGNSDSDSDSHYKC